MIDGGFMEGYTFSSPFWALASDVFLWDPPWAFELQIVRFESYKGN